MIMKTMMTVLVMIVLMTDENDNDLMMMIMTVVRLAGINEDDESYMVPKIQNHHEKHF